MEMIISLITGIIAPIIQGKVSLTREGYKHGKSAQYQSLYDDIERIFDEEGDKLLTQIKKIGSILQNGDEREDNTQSIKMLGGIDVEASNQIILNQIKKETHLDRHFQEYLSKNKRLTEMWKPGKIKMNAFLEVLKYQVDHYGKSNNCEYLNQEKERLFEWISKNDEILMTEFSGTILIYNEPFLDVPEMQEFIEGLSRLSAKLRTPILKEYIESVINRIVGRVCK